MRRTDKTYAVGEIPWLYPHRDTPPRGVKLNLLQEGGTAIHGEWRDRAGYVGWQYLFRRDRQAEEEARVMAMAEGDVTPQRRFRVPQTLPLHTRTWQRVLNARWHDTDDGVTDVAAIYKLIDGEGFTTPVTYQYDHRNPPQFKSGYGILNTEHVFPCWSDLVAFWPEYLRSLEAESQGESE